MKPYFLFLPISVLLLTSCGSEPTRRAAQPQAPPVAVQSAAVADAGLARELRSHRHGPRAHHGHDLEQSDGLRAAGDRASRRPCPRRPGADHAGRARPGRRRAPRRGRPRRSPERHPRSWRTPPPPPKPIWTWRRPRFKRMEELAAKKSISNQEFDEASARLKAAQANYDMVALAARPSRLQDGDRSEQEIRAAGIMRDYAKLAAPFAGVVIARSGGAGQSGHARRAAAHHRAGWRLPPGSVGGRIETGLRARGPGGGSRDRRVDRKTECARLRDRAVGGRRVAHLHRETGSSRRRRSCAPACSAGPSSRSARRRWWPSRRRALMERGQLQSVFVVEDGVAHTRLVTTGRRAGRRGGSSVRPERGRESRACPCPPGLQDGARVEVRQ